MRESSYGVWLYESLVGTLIQRGDYTVFTFADDYFSNPDRGILGLIFEQDPGKRHASALRLPPWFSNLLPEGKLREWIATDRGVAVEREMELLAQVGHDLPGAVRVIPSELTLDASLMDLELLAQHARSDNAREGQPAWRFSLAGVAMKFSMVKRDTRLVLPAFGEGGDWIVKLPDPMYADVPLNEHAMMTLAAKAGLDVPPNILVDRDHLDGLPETAWMSTERTAYAVKRFDRGPGRTLVHIEDFCQVRDFLPYSDGKYRGNFETVGSICYRGYDIGALQEFARRLAFNTLISNGDAHLKNWSLIYRDPRSPVLSPVYDLVSTAFYKAGGSPEDHALKFRGSRRFDLVNMSGFRRLEERLGVVGARLVDCVAETVERVVAGWPSSSEILSGNPALQDSIAASIDRHRKTLLRMSEATSGPLA